MADTDRSLAVATGQDELAHGSLRIWDAIAISVSVIAPGIPAGNSGSPGELVQQCGGTRAAPLTTPLATAWVPRPC
jgi:hypothetical protein